MKKPLFQKVVIIGVGQIGASIGMNLVKRGIVREVIGVGRSVKNLKEAVRLRAIHRYLIAIPSGLSQDDLVILATPVQSIVGYLKNLPREPLVIDVGSTKASVVKEATQHRLRFVGCHPIAGTERGGAGAADINLFRSRRCLLTPTPSSNRGDRKRIEQLWKRLGSEVVWVDAEKHDRLLAAVSHLPHIVAYSLVAAVARLISIPKDSKFALGGLKDTTRIAQSPPEMWHDIFLENKKNILLCLKRFRSELAKLESFIRRNDSPRLMAQLKKSQVIRSKF